MTPEQQEVYDLVEGGLSIREAARTLGKAYSGVNGLYRRAKAWADSDSNVSDTAKALGLSSVNSLRMYYDKNHELPDGRIVTALVTNNVDQQSSQDVLERIVETFANITPYKPMRRTERGNDILAVYPLMDAHFGMQAWGMETGGQDYDLKHAASDLKQAFTDLCAEMPDADTAILVLGGDTLHADDNEGHTQSRKHTVDTDGRLYKTSEVAIGAIEWVIDHLCQKHAKLIIRVLRGNHDEHSHLILHFSLASRYRDAVNIEVVDAQTDHYWYRHGVSLIAFHHGDKRPAKDLAMFLADTCQEWSATSDRHLLTGHIHHDSVKEFAGVKWWSLRAFCPTDKYGHMFGSRRALQGFKFSAKFGWKGNEVEPILRGEK